GVVVTVALTRAGGRIGWLYGWDLVGAAVGALLVVPLLDQLSLTSVFFLAGAVASAAAVCFARFAGETSTTRAAAIGLVLVAAAIFNGSGYAGLGVRFSKDRPMPPMKMVDTARWNS